MNNSTLKILIIGIACCFLLSCAKEKEPLIIKNEFNYNDIYKIFENNGCNSCHSDVTNDYNTLVSNWVDKSIDALETVLYKAIREGGQMNEYMSNANDIESILKWIQQGAVEGESDSCTGGSIDTVYLELPAFISYDASIKTLFNDNCLGCHHNADEIIYEQLFTNNAHGVTWIDTSSVYDQTVLYNAIKSGGDMSSYFGAYERNIVIQWMSYGAIKNN